ncbi:hypothetical protein OPT61_g7492 [Boeremia exigua]|uniref:Uncharacterized protein n=1 Tax=Boeremia exigua TaxID=749465 RepID=A0ACC2I3Q8_9PLEO|nr:hypothetical protein OPT61_g7492 [Boeremia exigua]
MYCQQTEVEVNSSRTMPALPVGQVSPPISRTSPRALDAAPPTLFPAAIFTKHTSIRPKSDTQAYLQSDLQTPQLNDIHHLLWLAGLPNAARPLHRQKLLGRSILISEDPNEHLVWFENEIYIKPLPDYLFEYDFWASSICADNELRLAASGLLLSYAWLVQHKSDLAIAQDVGLLPKELDWSAWTQFLDTFLNNINLQTLEHVSKRYHYGELRLTRLNTIYRFAPPKYTLHSLVRGYRNKSTWYQAFFTRHFRWMLAVFAIFSVVLSALQVGLATDRLQNVDSFQAASYGSAVTSLVAIVAKASFLFIIIMSFKPKGPVVRVSGLPQCGGRFTNSQLDNLLRRALQKHVLYKDKRALSVHELSVEIVPSCTNDSEQVALVEFHDGLPDCFSGLGTERIKTDQLDVSIDNHFYGFTQLYRPKAGAPITADIIAITGLDGHAYGSWRGKSSGTMWLRDILSKNMPQCRTMTYGYNSKLSQHGFGNIVDYSRKFLDEIRDIRSTDKSIHRPIIFVAHSFGGIILAQSLISASRTNKAYDPVVAALHTATCGLLLFGIPHQGLIVDDIEAMLAANKNKSRSALLDQLKIGSHALRSIQEPFRELIVDSGYKIISFYETHATPRLEFDHASKRWMRSGVHQIAVDPNSALLQLPSHLERKVPISANHSTIVKFEAKSSPGFCTVLRYMKEFEREALSFDKAQPRTQGIQLPATRNLQPGGSNISTRYVDNARVATAAF